MLRFARQALRVDPGAPATETLSADWVRSGIATYGSAPDHPQRTAADWGLQPAMTLSSRLIAVQQLQAGDTVGYGSAFTADGPMRIGVVACGYADGYPRLCPTGTPVLVGGVRSRTLGRVSMDMLAVDLSPERHPELPAVPTLREQKLDNLYGVPTPQDMLRMFRHGRVKLLLANTLTLDGMLAEQGMQAEQLQAQFDLMPNESYIAFSRQTDARRVERWQQALLEMRRDGSLEHIYRHWLPWVDAETLAELLRDD